MIAICGGHSIDLAMWAPWLVCDVTQLSDEGIDVALLDVWATINSTS